MSTWLQLTNYNGSGPKMGVFITINKFNPNHNPQMQVEATSLILTIHPKVMNCLRFTNKELGSGRPNKFTEKAIESDFTPRAANSKTRF